MIRRTNNSVVGVMRLAFTVAAVATLLCAGLATTPAYAAVILGTYQFASSDSEVPTSTGMTFGAFGRNIVTAVSTSGVFNSKGWNTGISLAEYVNFTLTANSGYRLILGSMTFDTMGDSKRPTTGEVRYSNNSYALGGTFIVTNTSANKSWDFADVTTAAAGSVTFRLYGYNAQNAQGEMRFDNMAITGDTQALARLSASAAAGPAKVLVGATGVQETVTVNNSAFTAGTMASQGLDYTLGLSGAVGMSLVTSSGTNVAAGASNDNFVAVNTATSGAKSATLTIASTNAWQQTSLPSLSTVNVYLYFRRFSDGL